MSSFITLSQNFRVCFGAILIAFGSFLIPNIIQAQTCDCNEYVYLNETANGGRVHKFRVDADGTLTEINPTNQWYPNGAMSEMSAPHGLAIDVNGNVYVGESTDSLSDIRKLDCDGNLVPESEFIIPDEPIFNSSTIGNTMFTRPTNGSSNPWPYQIRTYDLCDGSYTGDVCLELDDGSVASPSWGMYQDPVTLDIYVYSSHGNGSIFKFNESNIGGACINPIATDLNATGIMSSTGEIQGITLDPSGNIYLVNNDGWGTTPAQILKFDANGQFVCSTGFDTVDGDGGWHGAIGIVYSPTCDCLLGSSFTFFDDCVSKFDLDCNYLGAAVDPIGNASNNTDAIFGKGISVKVECCPVNANTTETVNICGSSVGDMFLLNDYLPCDSICAGSWTEVSNTLGGYDECSNTITYQQEGAACFTYDYVPTGTNLNEICSEFHIEICFEVDCCSDPAAPVINVSNNTCPSTTDGSFNVVTACGTGSHIEWSTDGGTSWSTTTPIWADGLSVVARCVDSGDASCISPSSDQVTAVLQQCTYDLALTKVTTSAGPYAPGDVVSFDICVENQGELSASGVQVTDYIPAGMSFSSSADFTTTAPHVATISSIAVGATECVSIDLQIDATFTGTSLINDAEITADDGDDVDSTPGDDATPDDTANDNDTADTAGGDDQDPEEVTVVQPDPIYDLALTKVTTSAGPYAPVDVVSFDICVENQGEVAASGVQVTDYIPTGMTFSASTDFSATAPHVATIASIAVGATECVSIDLQIDATFTGTSLINDAEITADDGDDVDSTPADDGTPDDTANDNDTADTAGGDDQDPEEVTVVQPDPIYDLALTKVTTSAGPYAPGDVVSFDICVENQGEVAASGVEVTDYIPAGMSFSSSADFTATAPHVATISSIAVGATECVSIDLQIDATFTGTSLINDAEITADDGDDVDSTPADDGTPDDTANDNDTADTAGGDDQDPEEVTVEQEQPVYDLAIEKMLITDGPYEPGDTIEYTIVVTNQGTSDASNITVTDDSDANLNFVGSKNGDETSTIDSISAPAGMELVWSDDFVGAAVDPTKWEVFTGAYGTPYRLQTYTDAPENVRVENGALILEATLEDDQWYSGMVHTNDVAGPDNTRWATGNLGWTFGRFEIRAKVPHATGMWPALWMRPIDYNYTYNGMSGWPLNGEIDILEYIGPDRDPTTPNAPINELIANAHWQLNGNRQQQKGTFNLGGPAAAAAYVSEWHTYAVEWTPNRLEFFVDGQMYHFIENWTSDTGGIGPFDQDFDIIMNLQVGGWAGDPLASSAGSQMEIDWVRVYQDSLDETINVTDNGDETFTIGSIPAGMDETITVCYVIDSSFAGTMITNQAQITGDDGDDIDSNPDTDYGVDEDGDGDGDDDDEDEVVITVEQPVYDLALTKVTTSTGPYAPGDIVSFDICVVNQGDIAANNVEVTDYIPAGMLFSASADFSVTAPHIATIANVAVGATECVSIDLQIDPAFVGTSLINDAEITADDGDDADSTPADDGTPDDTANDDDTADTTGGDDQDPAEVSVVQPVDCQSIGGEVFVDANDNGCQDAGETTMVPGTIVVIWECDPASGSPSSIVDTTVTGLDGTWTYGGLDPATGDCLLDASLTYTAQFSIFNQAGDPYQGYAFSSGTADGICTVGEEDDIDPATGIAEQCYDPSTDPGDHIDAGIVPPPVSTCEEIGGEVWVDLNDDGCQDAGETTMVPGIEVVIWECDPITGAPSTILDTTYTFLDGTWSYGGTDPATGECILDNTSTYTASFTVIDNAANPYQGYTFSSGTAAGTCAEGEEDDIDPATGIAEQCYDPSGDSGDNIDAGIVPPPVETYDLAIEKTVTSTGPYSPGSTVTYQVVITNQGTQDAANTTVTDTPQTGLVYSTSDAGANTNVTESTALVYDIASLPAGSTETINLTFTIDGSFTGTTLVNDVQITGDDGDDVDSDPSTDDGTDENGDGNGDDDDEDEVEIPVQQANDVYDLAIDKAILTAGPYSPGSSITYQVVITNQGNLDASTVQFLDTPQAGLVYVGSNATSNANITEVVSLGFEVASLLVGASETVELTFTIDNSFTGNTLTNDVWIVQDDGDDVDSDPSTDDGTDENGDGSGDDDDEDEVIITIQPDYDLAINKIVIGAGPFSPGSTVSYGIAVTNQGGVNATNVQFADMPQLGLTYVASDASANPNITEISPMVFEIANLAAGSTEGIVLNFTIDAGFTGTSLVNDAQITADDGDDVDSDPATGDGVDEDGDGSGDDDDEDEVVITVEQDDPVYDLAIDKATISSGPYSPGSTVVFTVTVSNQGTEDAANIELTDIPQTGLNFVMSDAGGNANVTELSPMLYTIASLPAGQSETITLSYIIDTMFAGTSLNNLTEITLDDGGDIDSEPNNDDGDQSEDDEDEEIITVGQTQDLYDLAIDKIITSAGPYTPGSSVAYQITVTNQGSTDAANVQFNDSPQSGLNYVMSDVSGNANVTEISSLNYEIASLPAGQTETILVEFVIDASFAGTSLDNITEITADDGDDIDSAPGNDDGDQSEDDEDGASIPVEQSNPIYDLAIEKAVTNAGPYSPGSTVTYVVTISNQGSVDASNVQISDSPQAGLNYVMSDASGNANITESGSLVFDIASLLAGQSETIMLSFIIDASFAGTTLDNDVQITEDDGDDIDSDPSTDENVDEDGDGNGDDDDEDGVQISVEQVNPVYDLAIDKVITSSGPYTLGSTVTYAVTVSNQGDIDANNIQFMDMPSTGLIYTSSNANSNANVNELSSMLFEVISLPAGQSETVSLSFTIDSAFAGGNLSNDALITLDDGDDIDSNPSVDGGGDDNGDGVLIDDDEASTAITITNPCGQPDCLTITIRSN